MPQQIKQLTNQDIKEQMFKLAAKRLDTAEQRVYGWLFDELESRLTDDDFDNFLDQVDQITKH